MIVGICSLFGYFAPKLMRSRKHTITILAMGAGGYLAYLYVAFGLPGAARPINEKGTAFILLSTVIGMVIGLGIGLLYYRFKTRKK